MGLQSAKIDEAKKTITLVMDLEPARDSKSGRTKVVASTGGNVKTGAMLKGKELVAGINIYYKE